MELWELFLIAAGLSMDAFAAAVCRGLAMKKMRYGEALLTATLFGGFQGLMPIIGWLLGVSLEDRIKAVDHWAAFFLLSAIGVKMMTDSLKDEGEESSPSEIKGLFLMALATSIDALAVGVTFAFLGVDIIHSAVLIATVTATLSFVGVILGRAFGGRLRDRAGLAGGIILIFIGIKILVEHLLGG